MNFVTAKNNPFTIQRLHALDFRFEVGDWRLHISKLRAMNFRASVVGRCGSGKSTLLRQLCRRLNGSGTNADYFNLTRLKNQHAGIVQDLIRRQHRGAVLIVDGIERMSFPHRLKLIKKTKGGSGLIVSNHYWAALPVWIRTKTSASLLNQVLQDLGVDDPDINDAANELYRRYRGNLRHIFFELYDQIADKRLTLR